MPPLRSLSCFALLAVAACSSSRPEARATPDAGPGVDAGPGALPGAQLQTVELQMNQTIAAGQEAFKCQLVKLPAATGWMVHGQHTYTPGSHHLLVFTTDLTSIPAGQDQVQDCYEGTDAGVMSHIRGVLYGGQTPTGAEVFPSGIGIPTTPEQIVLLQVHYLNASAASLAASVDIKLTLDTGTDIQTNAGMFFFYDPFIYVPQGARAQAQMRCVVPSNVTMLSAQSHYHSRGVGYSAYIDPPSGPLSGQAFYTSNSWDSPALDTTTRPIAAGSRLRFECAYDNTAGTQDYFQGSSASQNEMCMFIGAYYPELGTTDDLCLASPDMFGTGATTCPDALTCLTSCPSISLGTGASSCVQKCVAQSCPSAFGALLPLLECIKGSCLSAGADGGPAPCASVSDPSCTACIAASCGSQYGACLGQTCP